MKYKTKYVVQRLILMCLVLPLLVMGIYFLASQKNTILRSMGIENANSPERNMPKHLVYAMPDSLDRIQKNDGFRQALFYQSMYLLRPSTPTQPTKDISKQDLLRTLHNLRDWESFDAKNLSEHFDFYRVKTALEEDKVRVTGYYTPVIDVQTRRTSTYNVPFLKRPDAFDVQEFIAQNSIQTGTYQHRDISLAWTNSERKVKNAILQGSAFVQYQNGKKAYLGYHSEANLGLSEHPKYVFFQKLDTLVLGAGGFPLTAFYSVAVDTRFIPLGACLFAELPILNEKGEVVAYTHKILFAQDTGGAIKTTKKLDLYCGIGKEGLKATELHNQYCKLWLLLSKSQ